MTITRRTCFLSTVAAVLSAAVLLTATSPALATACTGPGTLTSQGGIPQTQCQVAIPIPGNPLRSFGISWVDPSLGLYFLGDRSNAGVDVIGTQSLTFPANYHRGGCIVPWVQICRSGLWFGRGGPLYNCGPCEYQSLGA